MQVNDRRPRPRRGSLGFDRRSYGGLKRQSRAEAGWEPQRSRQTRFERYTKVRMGRRKVKESGGRCCENETKRSRMRIRRSTTRESTDVKVREKSEMPRLRGIRRTNRCNYGSFRGTDGYVDPTWRDVPRRDAFLATQEREKPTPQRFRLGLRLEISFHLLVAI